MDFNTIKQTDQQYVANTYGRFDLAIQSGKNATCHDFEGKEYIDLTSGIGVNSLGFCDERLVRTLTEQAQKVWHVCNLFYNEHTPAAAKLLCEKSGYQKVFWANSGAEANEGAIKTARKYSINQYGEQRNKIVTLVNSFHGRTVTTLAATGQAVFHKNFMPFTEGFVFAEANNIENLKNAVDENTCAIMLEFVQGEGGVLPLTKEFVAAAEQLCREKDLLFIADEVQTGIGRTGRLFCCEHYGVKPDIITAAKGLGGGFPIGAVLFNEKTRDVLGPSDHGTTFGGNPLACACAETVLGVVANDGFLSEVEKKGQYIREKLARMDKVKEVRGYGLMLGIDVDGKDAKTIAKDCVANGLMVLTAKTSVRFLPPLTVTYGEIDKAMAIFESVIGAGKEDQT